MFSLELKIPGLAVQSIYQTAKNGNFCEELLSENDIGAFSATFCSYDRSTKASEAVQKIGTGQKEYRKYSSRGIIY